MRRSVARLAIVAQLQAFVNENLQGIAAFPLQAARSTQNACGIVNALGAVTRTVPCFLDLLAINPFSPAVC